MNHAKYAALTAMVLAGCALATNIGEIEKACGGLTLELLKTQNSFDPACRAAITRALNDVAGNFSGQVLPLGSQHEAGTNRVLLYAAAVSPAGDALGATDFSGAQVTAVAADGTKTTLGTSDFTVTGLSTEAALSLSMVNDYSGSMRDDDLDSVARIESLLFTYLPAIYEAEVLQFSAAVTQRLDYSTSKSAVLAAVARGSYDQQSTALLDAMSVGLTRLETRARPAKVLFVATDGRENSSKTSTESSLLAKLANDRVFVVMLGTLFADQDAMKRLTAKHGVFVYAPSLEKLEAYVTNFIKALGQPVVISVSSTYASAASFLVTVAGSTGSF